VTIRLVRDLTIPLRDGIATSAEAWIPDDGKEHPAILVRTPYLKETAAPTAIVDSRVAASRGYAVVLQDVRGRGGSAGSFEPFVHEESDGYDTVAWVAEQSWCDGDVVMAGASYVGATQWLAAASDPLPLRAIAPTLSSDDYGEGWSYRAGVPELGFLTSWCATELAPEAARLLDDPSAAWKDVAIAEKAAPWLRQWLMSDPDSEYWRERSVAHRRSEIRVPVLTVAGWYDIFLSASLRAFQRSVDGRDRLIVGPWGHSDDLSHLIGTANVGAVGGGYQTFAGWLLDFYDSVLADRDPGSPKVRAYVLGQRRWIALDAWPPPGGDVHTLPLEPGSFDVDPGAPVPSLGGRGLLINVPGSGFGVADQRPLVNRSDVHEALSHTVGEGMLVAGPIRLSIATAADRGADCERFWAATLCVEQPNGELHNLVEGIARARPGTSPVEVDLGDTLAWIPRGSKLVLLIAGSSFPRWPLPPLHGKQEILSGSTIEMTLAPITNLERQVSPP
jgi:putative CocE/NonD family hydrolase